MPPIGRDREIDEVVARLRRGPTLVWGPPGIGKTTVLDAVAARWPGEVVVAAGPSPDAALRLALGVAVDASLPRAMAARPGTLFVVDDTDASHVASLPAGAAVVCASRTRGDGVVLGPLTDDDAVAVYLAAAARVAPSITPSPEAVRATCSQLGGVPLALVVAGSRIRTLPPGHPGLLAGLVRGGPLAQAVEASVGALGDDARDALSACAWFQGGFDAEAFEAVAGAGALIEELLDAALVEFRDGGRLRLPPTVREWLREQPRSGGARHAAWAAKAGRAAFGVWRRTGDWRPIEALRDDLGAAVAREGSVDAATVLAELHLRRGPQLDPLARLHVPPDRLLAVALLRARLMRRTLQHDAALALLDAAPPPEDAVLATNVALERSHHLSALRRTAEAEAWIPHMSAPIPSPEHAAEASLAAAILHQRAGRVDDAVTALRRGAALAQAAGLPELRARLGAHLGAMARTRDPEEAERALEAALADYERLGDERWQGIVAQWLALHHQDAGHLDRARALLDRSLIHCARAGATSFEVQALLYRAGAAVEARDLDAARRDLDAAHDLGVMSPTQAASLRAHRGLLAHADGDPEAALAHYVEAIDAFGAARGAVATWSAFAAMAAIAAGRDPAPHRARLSAVTGTVPGDDALAAIVDAAASGTPLARAGLPRDRSDVRLLLALADGAAVRVARDGRTVVGRDGAVVSLGSRPILVRLLAALAEAGPGVPRSRDALFAVGWPGQRMVGASGQSRLHVAISTLRRFGAPITTVEDGGGLAYALDAAARVTD